MKSLRQELWFEIPDRRGFLNITPEVEDLVKQSGVQEGLCLVNAMHITTCVDFSSCLQRLQNWFYNRGLYRWRLRSL